MIFATDGTFTYDDLARAAAHAADVLLNGADDLREARVAFVSAPSFAHLATLRGIWRAGGVAVPLATSHPPAELEYVIRDADASVVVADPEFVETIEPLARAAGATFFVTHDLLGRSTASPSSLDHRRPWITVVPGSPSSAVVGPGRRSSVPDDVRQMGRRSSAPDDVRQSPHRRALIVYTSGTTARPKGVVSTHGNLAAQIGSLVTAWAWTPSDRTLLVLPLHHVHGIVNVVGCALAVGATLDMLPSFDAEMTWARLASGDITVFTAVPTIYRRLIQSWEAAPPAVQRRRSDGCRRVRLMMSGSAALPAGTLDRWRAITGHTLLERYGMTELGMALSNPLHGDRLPGRVGRPLPGVEARIVDEQGTALPEGSPGELEIRGPNVFLEYWRRPDETREAFHDGWFRTGDVAVVEGGVYRLLGRTSVDIIKTGGYKVSALEIEEVVREHPCVADCAVVGVPDAEWGERVSAAVELVPDRAAFALSDLQDWARARLAPYKVPKAVRCVSSLPRNAMGKVIKGEVVKLFE